MQVNTHSQKGVSIIHMKREESLFTGMCNIPIVRMIEIVIRVGIRRSNGGGGRRRNDPFISGRNLLAKWIEPKMRFGFTEIKIEKGEYLVVVVAADIIRHDGSFTCEKSTHLVNEHFGAINGSVKML